MTPQSYSSKAPKDSTALPSNGGVVATASLIFLFLAAIVYVLISSF